MDAAELFSALRTYYRKRRVELLESLLTTTDVEKTRGRVREVDEAYQKLGEIYKTTGDEDDADNDQ